MLQNKSVRWNKNLFTENGAQVSKHCEKDLLGYFTGNNVHMNTLPDEDDGEVFSYMLMSELILRILRQGRVTYMIYPMNTVSAPMTPLQMQEHLTVDVSTWPHKYEA